VILDRRPSPPEVANVHKGSSTFDRPSIDNPLSELDDLRSGLTDTAGSEAILPSIEPP
jgi:peroxiredoxin Q/BCP